MLRVFVAAGPGQLFVARDGLLNAGEISERELGVDHLNVINR